MCECVYPTVVVVSKTSGSTQPACLPAYTAKPEYTEGLERGESGRQGYVNEAFLDDEGRSGSLKTLSADTEAQWVPKSQSSSRDLPGSAPAVSPRKPHGERSRKRKKPGLLNSQASCYEDQSGSEVLPEMRNTAGEIKTNRGLNFSLSGGPRLLCAQLYISRSNRALKICKGVLLFLFSLL